MKAVSSGAAWPCFKHILQLMDTVAQVGGREQGVAQGRVELVSHAGNQVAQGGELFSLHQVF